MACASPRMFTARRAIRRLFVSPAEVKHDMPGGAPRCGLSHWDTMFCQSIFAATAAAPGQPMETTQLRHSLQMYAP